MKAVIYARYSSDGQREESIEGQIRECIEYAQHNGITVLTHYIDRALSARTADRPEFQRMISDSETHIFDIVLVWKLDRFSRNRYFQAGQLRHSDLPLYHPAQPAEALRQILQPHEGYRHQGGVRGFFLAVPQRSECDLRHHAEQHRRLHFRLCSGSCWCFQ